jgi:hypothetical protein
MTAEVVAELATAAPEPAAARGWLSTDRARRLGWAAFAMGSGLRVIQLWLVTRMGPDSVRFTFDIGPATFLAAIVLGTASGLVGAIIVARRPGNVVGWLYVLTGLMQGVITLGLAYGALTLATSPDDVGVFFAWQNGAVDYAIPFSFAALVLALFPDGRLVSRSWRIVIYLAIVGGVLRFLEVAFGARTLVLVADSTNPYRLGGVLGDVLGTSSVLGVGSLMVEVAFVLAALSLGVRYRASSEDGRRQILWLLMAGLAAVLSTLPLVYGTLIPGSLPAHFDAIALLFAALTLAPIATLVAITRYRLYEIDRIVNRALVYGSLTAILAGIFTAGIALAQRMFVHMTGEKSDAAIVATTLVVATLYAPLRKRLEAIVDRWFKYEAREFGAYRDELRRLLSATDPARASQRLVRDATAELDAIGGAVLDSRGTAIATAGDWPVAAALRIPLHGRAGGLDTLVIGPRRDGRPYDPGTVVALEELGSLVGAAVR